MKLNYINKIKANIAIFSNKKTNNILDGTYKSIYRGKSMNFENLREYVINDDIKDIDWKASAKTNTLYVKQFIAEKKHNILFIIDNNETMYADTNQHENKKNVSLYTAGTIGYLAIKNNDYIGMLYKDDSKINYKPFKNNIYNLEEYICNYNNSKSSNNTSIDELLEYAFKNISKRMIIIAITDIKGINSIKETTLKKLKFKHDLLIVNINDNYMSGENVFDIKSKKYISNFILKDTKLNQIEKELRNELINQNKDKLMRHKVTLTTISSIKEINYKIIHLLEEHKYASRN